MLRIATFLFSVLFGATACAGINNSGSGSGSVGNAQLNLGAGVTAQTFINLLSSAFGTGFTAPATPAVLDADGYPVRNFTGKINYITGVDDQVLATTGPWIMSWPAGRSAFTIEFDKSATTSNPVNATIVNGTGSGVLTVSGDGVHAGSVTINWNTTASPGFDFVGSSVNYTTNTGGTIALYRATDQAAFNAGEFYTSEYINFIKALHPRALRPMGLNLSRNFSDDSNVTSWVYRKKTTALSFIEPNDYPPGVRSGGATSFTAISSTNGAYTAAAAADTPLGGWVAGEQIVGPITGTVALFITGAVSNGGNVQLTVASTTGLVNGHAVIIAAVAGTTEANGSHTILTVDDATHFTINVSFVHTYSGPNFGSVSYQSLTITGKSGGSKVIVNNFGLPIGQGPASDQANIITGWATFTYDSVLDAVIYTDGGISNQPPIEVQAQLANRVNSNFWYNLPPWATDNYVTSVANAIYSNLNSNLKLIFEYTNEMWAFGWNGTHWASTRAGVLGIGGNLDYQGLRIRQINGNLLPATSWATAMSRLERGYFFQSGTGPGDTSITGPMTGSNLISPGNAAYQAFVGGSAVNYNIAPNRPIDATNTIGYAPYVGGGTALSAHSPDIQLDNGSAVVPTSFDAPLLQSIATNYNAGGAGITTAIGLIDDSVRWGRNRVQTVTASGTLFTTPLAHNFAAFDSLRFSVSGGTPYSGIDVKKVYMLVPTGPASSTTFAMREVLNGSYTGPDVNAGSAGTGTMSVGVTGSAGQSVHMFNTTAWAYTKWESVAASLSADVGRPGTMGALKVEWYEAALEVTAPNAAECLAVGVTLPGDATGGTAATAIANAILAWKFNSLASLAIQTYYKSFMGTDTSFITSGVMPHSAAPAHLVLFGGGVYALNSNFSFVSPAPYQFYNGFAAFSTP